MRQNIKKEFNHAKVANEKTFCFYSASFYSLSIFCCVFSFMFFLSMVMEDHLWELEIFKTCFFYLFCFNAKKKVLGVHAEYRWLRIRQSRQNKMMRSVLDWTAFKPYQSLCMLFYDKSIVWCQTADIRRDAQSGLYPLQVRLAAGCLVLPGKIFMWNWIPYVGPAEKRSSFRSVKPVIWHTQSRLY